MREHCAVVVDVAVAVAVPHDGVLVPHGGCAAARTGGPAVVRAVDTGVGRLLAALPVGSPPVRQPSPSFWPRPACSAAQLPTSTPRGQAGTGHGSVGSAGEELTAAAGLQPLPRPRPSADGEHSPRGTAVAAAVADDKIDRGLVQAVHDATAQGDLQPAYGHNILPTSAVGLPRTPPRGEAVGGSSPFGWQLYNANTVPLYRSGKKTEQQTKIDRIEYSCCIQNKHTSQSVILL